MNNSKEDSDGYTSETRRDIVHTAVERVRARGIEPRPDLLLLYERYIKGEISRSQLSALMHERLEGLVKGITGHGNNRQIYERPSSH